MSGPMANMAAEFAALTGRMQHILSSIPDNTAEYGELASVCERHGIKVHRRENEMGEDFTIGLAEGLDNALAAANRKVRKHDELEVALDDAKRARRDAVAEVERARRDGDTVLALIGQAKGKLDQAGFNTDAMGWMAGLDDALAELDAWRTGRRRAPNDVGAL